MASEASVAEQSVAEKMQTVASEDTDNASEASLLQSEEVKGKEEEEKIIVEDLASVHAAIPEPKGKDKSVSESPTEAEDDGLKEKTDVPNDTQPSNELVVEHHEDVSEKSIIEDSVQTPKEPVLSESAGEGNSVEASAVGQESAHDATVILNSNGTEENPTSEESTYDAIEVSPESSKEEVPQSGISEQILNQTAEVVSTESNVETSNTIPTTEVAEFAKEEIDVKGENEEKDSDAKGTASTETIKNEEDRLHEKADAPNGTQSSNEPIVKQHEDVLEKKSITEDLVQTPKEPTLSETVGEDSVQESSETSTLDQESTHDDTIILNSNRTEENPSGGESTYDVVSVIPTETKELQEQTITSELPTQKTDDADPGNEKTTEEEDKPVVSTENNVEIPNTTPTTEVAKLAKEGIDVKEENGEENIDGEETASTETTQIVASNGSEEAVNASEGVELIDQVKNENLEGETTRDIEVVQVENKVSDDPQSESKASETEVKSVTKQTLLDKFATENAEDGKQATAQVGDRSIQVTTKDDGATKTDQEADKAELSGKKSRSVMSKVKQSIVKVKKAIIGKSPSSKTMTPEGNDDPKAK